jgi:hypothetical protein
VTAAADNWPAAERPGPPPNVLALREVLPMNSGNDRIKRGKAALMKCRTGARPFAIERVVVAADMSPRKRSWWMRLFMIEHPHKHGAADWLVHDITIDNRSQLATCGTLPGDMFVTNAVDMRLSFDVCEPRAAVCMIVEYIGPHRDALFYGCMVGASPIVHPVPSVGDTRKPRS